MPILWSYLAYCTTPYFALWEVFRHQKMIRLRRIWQCHDCHQGVVIPGIYINIHGETIKIDPNAPEAHKNPWSKHWSYAFLTIIPWFQHSIIPCRRPPSVVKSYMISIYYRNSETLGSRRVFCATDRHSSEGSGAWRIWHYRRIGEGPDCFEHGCGFSGAYWVGRWSLRCSGWRADLMPTDLPPMGYLPICNLISMFFFLDSGSGNKYKSNIWSDHLSIAI